MRKEENCFCYQSLLSKYGICNFLCLYIWFYKLAEQLIFQDGSHFLYFLFIHCFPLKTKKLKTFREWIAFIHYLLSIYHFIFFPWGKLVLRESFELCEPAFFPSGKQKGWKFPSFLFLFVISIAQATATPSGWLKGSPFC